MAENLPFKEKNLKLLNTFGIASKASQYIEVNEIEELETLRAQLGEKRPFLLGGGSNILFTKNPEEVVLGIRLKGIVDCIEGNDVHLHVAAGENWHEFTQHCVENNWGGLENLSLIPGQVGTAPVQNIGAYGVELKDHLSYVDAFDWEKGKSRRFTNEECEFAYRQSIFKGREKGRYLITAVGFKLSKTSELRTHYGAIREELEKMGRTDGLTYRDVAEAVIRIRKSKLPDPVEIGNAGSFFKNPEISQEQADELLKRFPEAPNYPGSNGRRKMAAGWLIEKAGWKGHRRGNHGVHERQALVLVNYGGASGKEILQLAEDIQEDINQRFGIQLEMEVNIYR